jgi:hypothetical protein
MNYIPLVLQTTPSDVSDTFPFSFFIRNRTLNDDDRETEILEWNGSE